mgnify:CR=1 FL=1
MWGGISVKLLLGKVFSSLSGANGCFKFRQKRLGMLQDGSEYSVTHEKSKKIF